MKLATAPVNWNSPDVPEYRAYTPYPRLLEEMVAAGYSATEWSSIMPKEPEVLAEDLRVRGLRMLGGFVGLELRNPTKREQEVQKGVEIGKYFQSLGASYLIAADSGDPRRVQEAGRVGPDGGLSDAQWESLGAGLNQLGTLLKPAGVRLVFHNHVGTYVETEAETCRLLDATDAARQFRRNNGTVGNRRCGSRRMPFNWRPNIAPWNIVWSLYAPWHPEFSHPPRRRTPMVHSRCRAHCCACERSGSNFDEICNQTMSCEKNDKSDRLP
jgi:hypothetical protein